MLAGQLKLIDTLDFAELRTEPGTFDVNSNDSDGDSSLLFSEILSLCHEDRPESRAFSNGFVAEIEGGFPSTHPDRPFQYAMKSGLENMRIPGAPTATTEDNVLKNPPPTAHFDATAKPIEKAVELRGSCGSLGEQSRSAGVVNKGQLSDWMDAHALARSSHHCAMYCRLGLEAAGLNTADRPQSGDAGDYGPFLLRHGAQAVPQASYCPQIGDVVVFDKTAEHPYGHIEMYDGHHWVSDFKQRSISPYRDAASSPPYTIYRLA